MRIALSVWFCRLELKSNTHAAVEANISAGRAEVVIASATENINDIAMDARIRAIKFRMKYRTTMAKDGIKVAVSTLTMRDALS